MKTKRVLITGGAGSIGSYIAEQLARENPRELVVYDNFSRGRRENLAAAQAIYPITIINGDVCDLKHLHHAMEDIDFVFHQARVSPVECLRNPRLAMDVLVTGTFNVLEAAVGAGVSRVITTSPALEAIDTDNSVHAAAQRFSRGLLPSFAELYGLPYVTLRYDALYGPGMEMQGGLGEWIRNIEPDPTSVEVSIA